MKIKTVLFARVSTREQAEEGYSLPAQEKLLQDYVSKQEFSLVKKFSVPESASGKQERKLFNELLTYLEEHIDIKVVVCEKVDRITRNFKDAVRLDDWLNGDETRQIHFVKQNLIVHKNAKSNEKFMWDIYLAMARQYTNNLSEETKKGMNEKAAQGWYPGNHKKGYKTTGDLGHKIWVIDKENSDAKFIEIGFVLYDTGNYTLRTTAKELYEQGWKVNGKPISKSELHNILSDPFYCGEFIWKNKLYKHGKHEAIISKELFYRVQDRLKRSLKAGKYTKHNYLFGLSMTVCDECGRTVTWDIQKGHIYGHCTKYNTNCTQKKYISEDEVENQLKVIFDGLQVTNKRLLEWVSKALKESHHDESEFHEDIVKELDRQYMQAKRKLDTVYEDKVDGLITKEKYLEKKAEYEKGIENLLSAKEKHARANINYIELGSNIFEIAQKGRKVYEKLKLMNEKRDLLNFVFSNLKIRDGKVIPSYHNGFEVVAARAKTGDWLPSLDSNQNERIQSPLSYH